MKLRIIDVDRDLAPKKRRLFSTLNRTANEVGFLVALDFQMSEGWARYAGRIYKHTDAGTIFAAFFRQGFFGDKRIFEFYTAFSDGSRLVSTTSGRRCHRYRKTAALAQRVPAGASLSEAYQRHETRVAAEEKKGRQVTFDPTQKLLPFVEGF